MFYDDTDFLCHIKKCLLNKEYNFEFRFDNLLYNNKNNRDMFILTLSLLDRLELNCDDKNLIMRGKLDENISTNFSETDRKRLKGTIWQYETIKKINKDRNINLDMKEPEKNFSKKISVKKEDKINRLYNIMLYMGIKCKLEDNETCKLITITDKKLILNRNFLKNISNFINDFDIISVFSNYNYEDEQDDDILNGFRIVLGYSKEI